MIYDKGCCNTCSLPDIWCNYKDIYDHMPQDCRICISLFFVCFFSLFAFRIQIEFRIDRVEVLAVQMLLNNS